MDSIRLDADVSASDSAESNRISPSSAITSASQNSPSSESWIYVEISRISSRPVDLVELFAKHKEYRIIYDPEISKDKSKGKSPVYHTIKPESRSEVLDPRRKFTHAYSKYAKGKRVPFAALPVPKLAYDSNSLGPAPPSKLLISKLSYLTTANSIIAKFKPFGEIESCDMVLDPVNGMSLGMCHIRFKGSVDKAHKIGLKAINESSNITIDMNAISVEFDESSEKTKRKVASILSARPKPKPSVRPAPTAPKSYQKPLQADLKSEPEKQQRPERNSAKYIPPEPRKSITNQKLPSSHSDTLDEIGDLPYIFIRDRFLPTDLVHPSDVKHALRHYHWKRVIGERIGFYVVFESKRECQECFEDMDGRRIFEFRMVMDLHLRGSKKRVVAAPIRPQAVPVDPVEEATKRIVKELSTLLLKDIKERYVSPRLFESLNTDNFPSIQKELVAKKLSLVTSTVETIAAPVTITTTAASSQSNDLSKVLADLPRFRKKGVTKKAARPMTHRLNYDSDEEDDSESTRLSTPQVEDKKRVRKSTKKTPSSVGYSSSEDEEDRGDIKKVKLEEQPPAEIKTETPEEEDDDKMDVDEASLGDIKLKSTTDVVYDPAVGLEPIPVCQDDLDNRIFDFYTLQELVRDEEDYGHLRDLLKDTPIDEPIASVQEWISNYTQMYNDNKDILRPYRVGDSEIQAASEWDMENYESRRSHKYYKIPEADKTEYLPHRRLALNKKPIDTLQHDDRESSITNANNAHNSRMNRMNNRRLAADINSQKQMLSSDTDILNFNQLKKRKKPVKFARSAIHNWGLYAIEPISANEMIIEYVGESIRSQLGDLRERNYIRSGIGSSYLFRIDETTVIDATKRGGIARFINHCCTPSCTAKIIKVEGEKRIVIYALRDIAADEEITYDYKFERELNASERIPCLCGSAGCKGFLN